MTARARWAQLAYGSFPADAATGAPAGWRVEGAVGDPDEDETRSLLALAVSRFDSHEPFPAVGRPDAEYEALPRRFGYLRSPASASYWHSAQVDVDGFGRSGNVVSHLVLDRAPESAAPRRWPVSLWRSPDLRSPHQYARISLAPLAATLPRAGDIVTRDRIVDMLFAGEAWSVGVLSVLLDAVIDALAGGPAVALRCDDQDAAAQWIGAVCGLLGLADVRRLGFSMYERAAGQGEGAAAALERGVHLVVVPTGDGPVAGTRSIDVAATVTLGDPGTEHVLSDGTRVPAGVAGALVAMSVFDAHDARELLTAVDEVSRRMGDAATIDAAWPLALALFERDGAYPDAADLARSVVAGATPGSVTRDAGLRATALRAMTDAHDLDADAQDLWTRLGACTPGTLAERLLVGAYLERAVWDDEWLMRAEGAPTRDAVDPDAFASAGRAALRAVSQRPASDASHVRDARLAGFVAAVVPDHPSTEQLVDALLRRVVAAAVADDDVADALRLAGAFAAGTLDDRIVEILDDRARDAATPSTSILSTPPRALVALLGGRSTAATRADRPDSAAAWDLTALAVASDADHPMRDRLVARLLRRHGSWDAVPGDGQAILAASARAWTITSMLVATNGTPSVAPTAAVRATILRASVAELDGAVTLDLGDPVASGLARAVRDALRVERGMAPSTDSLAAVRGMLEVMSDQETTARLAPSVVALVFGFDATMTGDLSPDERTRLLRLLRGAAIGDVDAHVVVSWVPTRLDADARDVVATLAARAIASNVPSSAIDELDRAMAVVRDARGDRLVDVLAAEGLRTGRLAHPLSEADLGAMLVHVIPEPHVASAAVHAWWQSFGPRTVRDGAAARIRTMSRMRRGQEG